MCQKGKFKKISVWFNYVHDWGLSVLIFNKTNLCLHLGKIVIYLVKISIYGSFL